MTMRKAKSGKPGARLLIGLMVLTLVFSVAARKKKEQPNQLQEIKVEKAGEFFQVAISTNNPALQPSIYTAVEPARVFVDFPGVKLAKSVPALIEVNNGVITQIKINKATENNAELARVEIGLDKMMAAELSRADSQILILIKPPEQTEAAPPSDLYPTGPGKLIVEQPAEGATAALAAEAAPAATAEAEALEMQGMTPGAGAAGSTVGEAPSGKVGTKLLDVVLDEQKDQSKIKLVMDGTPGDFKSFSLKNPSRLVLDLYKVKSLYPGLQVMVKSQGIAKARIGQHPDKVRLVFDASAAKLPSYNIAREGERLVVTVSDTIDVTAPPAPMLAAPVIEAPAPPALEARPEVERAKVQAIDFKYTAQNSTVIIKTSEPVKYEKRENPDDLVFSIVLKDAQIPSELERSLDATEFASPINLIGSLQASLTEVNIIVNLNTWVQPEIKQEGSQIELVFANPGAITVAPPVAAAPAPPQMEEIQAPPELGPTPAAGVVAAAVPTAAGKPLKVETLSGTKIYTGAPIKIDAKNLDILDALRAIAEVSGLNIITSDQVTGRLTLKLDNVPWDQALDLILETKGLGMVQYGNVIRVAPLKDIQKEQEDAMKSIKNVENLRPLQTRIIPLNFAKAGDISAQIKGLLSDRGSVDVDKRTNSLIVKDIPERIQDIQVLVASLDARTPQVLIEARIVEASTGVTRELGVQWGLNAKVGPGTGNPTGLNFPNNIQIGGAVLGGNIDPTTPGVLNTVSSAGAGLGMTFGSLTGSLTLDLLLKAMETQNKIKIISSPRVLTMDNERAIIQQGVTIPYPPAINLAAGGAGGTQWQFVEAALRLEVTPHISPDGTIVLEVKASNNTPNLTVVSGGAPGIDKKEADTQIIMKDGETIVIGGIYTTKDSETKSAVPLLSRIPLLGRLFEDRFVESSRTELLIFLTPRIVK